MKKTLFASASAIVFGATLLATPVLANEKNWEEKVDWKMQEVDANKDGMISWDEKQTYTQQEFTDADTDGNKSLSRTELMEHMKKMKEEKHSKMDGMKKDSSTN
jgi:Ca2+-binding EF-hand superfamily protein